MYPLHFIFLIRHCTPQHSFRLFLHLPRDIAIMRVRWFVCLLRFLWFLENHTSLILMKLGADVIVQHHKSKTPLTFSRSRSKFKVKTDVYTANLQIVIGSRFEISSPNLAAQQILGYTRSNFGTNYDFRQNLRWRTGRGLRRFLSW